RAGLRGTHIFASNRIPRTSVTTTTSLRRSGLASGTRLPSVRYASILVTIPLRRGFPALKQTQKLRQTPLFPGKAATSTYSLVLDRLSDEPESTPASIRARAACCMLYTAHFHRF